MAQPPTRTDAERATALVQALSARKAAARIKKALAAGDVDLYSVLAAGHRGVGDRVLGHLEIRPTLLALPVWGPVKVDRLLRDVGVPGHRHLDELTADQVDAINLAVVARAAKS